MKKIWYGMVIFSLGLIYFHQQQLDTDVGPMMIPFQNIQSTKMVKATPFGLTLKQKKNLRNYHQLRQDSISANLPILRVP